MVLKDVFAFNASNHRRQPARQHLPQNSGWCPEAIAATQGLSCCVQFAPGLGAGRESSTCGRFVHSTIALLYSLYLCEIG